MLGPSRARALGTHVKQYLTFAGGTPLQHAAAAALRLPPSICRRCATSSRANRDTLCGRDRSCRLRPLIPAGTYFINADVGVEAVAFSPKLPERCGVVAIPTTAFYDDKARPARRSCASRSAAARGDRAGRRAAGGAGGQQTEAAHGSPTKGHD